MTNPLALIIEDDFDLAYIYAEAVREAQYETEIITHGLDALTRLDEVIPTLIVLDMHLPGVDGQHILAQIRGNERLKGVRVVIATADASMTHSIASSQADFVFIKPIRFEQLEHLAARIRPSV